MDMLTEVAIKEIEYDLMVYRLNVHGIVWKPRNRYEQFKLDHWPSWLKRWQPVKYGWVKN